MDGFRGKMVYSEGAKLKTCYCTVNCHTSLATKRMHLLHFLLGH